MQARFAEAYSSDPDSANSTAAWFADHVFEQVSELAPDADCYAVGWIMLVFGVQCGVILKQLSPYLRGALPHAEFMEAVVGHTLLVCSAGDNLIAREEPVAHATDTGATPVDDPTIGVSSEITAASSGIIELSQTLLEGLFATPEFAVGAHRERWGVGESVSIATDLLPGIGTQQLAYTLLAAGALSLRIAEVSAAKRKGPRTSRRTRRQSDAWNAGVGCVGALMVIAGSSSESCAGKG
jgi:hypothetical protein